MHLLSTLIGYGASFFSLLDSLYRNPFIGLQKYFLEPLMR